MNQKINPQSIQDKIAEAIKKGEVAMRPRWHFVLKTGLAMAGGVILALALIHIASLILFVLSQSGLWFVPGFGLRELWIFVISLPWILIAISIIFVILLELLVKHYAFVYRRPLLYSVLSIVVLTTVGGIAVAKTSLHQALEARAHRDELPVVGPVYRHCCSQKTKYIHPGTIVEIETSGFDMVTRYGEEIEVQVTKTTVYPRGKRFHHGDNVIVIGERDGDEIEARGIRPIRQELHRVHKRPKPAHAQPRR